MFAFRTLFNDVPDINIVDIGASPIDGDPAYQAILEQGGYRLTGFEPSQVMYNELLKNPHPWKVYLPYAVGDGSEATLHICTHPGMTSLLEPDLNILDQFQGFGDCAKVIDLQKVQTYRLDDIEEIQEMDYIKLDVQGGELSIIQNGENKIRNALVVHIETQFVPFYKNQPLFGELDMALNKLGFFIHKFGPLISRVFQPLLFNNDVYSGFSQILWSDAVYVRAFNQFHQRTPVELLKTARILHDVYGSYDLANLAMTHFDIQTGSDRQTTYLRSLTSS